MHVENESYLYKESLTATIDLLSAFTEALQKRKMNIKKKTIGTSRAEILDTH